MAGWIRRHPVVAFFVVAYVLAYPAEIVYYASPGTSDAKELLLLLAIVSPAAAAMLIAGIEAPRPKDARRGRRWVAFGLAWLVCAPILALYNWRIQGQALREAAVGGGVLAVVSAWIVSAAWARTPGVREQFRTLVRPRGPALWYGVVFLIFPGVPVLGMLITRWLGMEAGFRLSGRPAGDVAVFFALEFLRGLLLTGGINEETGWRGFALPRLQARYPVLVAAAIVWFFWAGWHIPYDLGEGVPLPDMLVNRVFLNLLVAILLAWVYNRTNGSILAPALFHPAMNTFGNQFEIVPITIGLLVLVTGVAIVADRMWRRLPAGHEAAFGSIGEAALALGRSRTAPTGNRAGPDPIS